MKTDLFYKIIDDLPQIPENLLQNGEFAHSSVEFKLTNGYIRDDGRTIGAARKTGSILPNLTFWIHNNIIKLNEKRFVCYREVMTDKNQNFYPPHIDIKRDFVLLYNVTNSGGDIVYWQEKGEPIYRDNSPGIQIKDYRKLNELCRFKSPHKKWYMLNNKIIHSVENIKEVRKNIQIECFIDDDIVIKSLSLPKV